jgi:DNA sulfur modification protein DndE
MRSLAENTKPSPAPLPPNSNVELTWEVFAGPWGDVLWLLVKQRCHLDGLGTEDEVVVEQFRKHLHRGVGYLAGDKIRSIEDLVTMEKRFTEANVPVKRSKKRR